MPTRKKYLTFKALTISISVAAVSMLSGCGGKPADAPVVRPALVFKIGDGAGIDAEVYPGEVRARVEADMAFRIGGKMLSRLVDQGATVRQGQPLATLDPQDVKLAADASRAQVNATKAEYDFAEAEAKRFKTLLDKTFISQSAYDAKVNARDAAKARFESATAQAAVNANQTSYATLVATQDGVVTQVMAEAGQVVAQGQPIMRIANPREKEVGIFVSESRIGEFRQQNKSREMFIEVSSAPGKRYPAKVREIAAAADPVTRTYPVRVSFAQSDENVRLGMTANVAFVGETAASQIAVPLSALYQQGDKTLVWVIGQDNKVTPRAVTVVRFRETSALITGPLKAGELIVAAGVHKLQDGQLVKPVTDRLITGANEVAIVPLDVPKLASRAQATH
ncbi:MAG: efflux RND transporter periplasmic adaptor subunit [Betaproteobacteria bacterium]|nr:efflux RND transporter periplasmic adaptor subunit [Betaproteobacteria bacterium]